MHQAGIVLSAFKQKKECHSRDHLLALSNSRIAQQNQLKIRRRKLFGLLILSVKEVIEIVSRLCL
jgi:hypothetical protein